MFHFWQFPIQEPNPFFPMDQLGPCISQHDEVPRDVWDGIPHEKLLGSDRGCADRNGMSYVQGYPECREIEGMFCLRMCITLTKISSH